MPDSKITALTALTAADPAVDMFPVVDVSDTTMAASGTTKRISINNILACSPAATLASATITGDLTVDTSTLKVDSANNRVGVGTASPITTLQVQDATLTGAGQIRELLIKANSNNVNNSLNSLIGLTFNSSAVAYTAGSLERTAGIYGINLDNAAFGRRMGLVFYTSEQDLVATEKYRIDNSGIATWSNVGGVAGTAMTLNATGLGVGNAPVAALDVYKAANDTINRTNATFCFGQIAGLGAALLGQQSASAPYQFNLQAANAANSVQFPLVLQPSGGNVGIGVAPSAGKGCLQLSSGINFPATQVASSDANTLDDYEEGTWTGTLKGSVSDPTTPVTATGAYTKVGRLVTVTIGYSNVNTTGASGNVTIAGLPFSGAASSAGSAITFDMFTTSTTLACWNAGTNVAFYVSGGFIPATHNAGASRSLNITISYYV